MNTIDIVIPTMWCDENFIDYLEKYCSYTNVNQIYLIDNQKQKRPNKEIVNHTKIKIICLNKNIYVNPAWNEGYYRSSAVKNDYDTWSKFVKDDGVILFHDTCVPHYGVRQFFDEIPLPKTNFTCSHGLGVVSKNSNLIEEIQETFQLDK